MIATVLSLWKSPTPNYIINFFSFYDELEGTRASTGLSLLCVDV